MKYMLLVYGGERMWDEQFRDECFPDSIELANQLHEKGKLFSASPLHHTSTATSVRVREGKQMVTDGPFAETHEQLGGYYLVDADDLDEAIDIAGRIPVAKIGTIEIRPIFELTGLPGE